MKTTPLFIRIIGGIMLSVLLITSCVIPLYTRGQSAAMVALGHRGKPYIFGKAGPEGYDCSGLTKVAYETHGVDLIHSAKYIAYDDQYETIEDAASLIPGDLIFFDTVADSDRYDHVGIWLGTNRFVHASSSEMVVMVSKYDAHWQECFSLGKRVIEPCEELKALYQSVQSFFV